MSRAGAVGAYHRQDGALLGSVKKTHLQCCTACDGAGITRDADYDDEGLVSSVNVRCEACDGVGQLSDCRRCTEPTPIPELEDGSGHCRACRVEMETGDQRDEMGRIGRRVA